MIFVVKDIIVIPRKIKTVLNVIFRILKNQYLTEVFLNSVVLRGHCNSGPWKIQTALIDSRQTCDVQSWPKITTGIRYRGRCAYLNILTENQMFCSVLVYRVSLLPYVKMVKALIRLVFAQADLHLCFSHTVKQVS